MHVNKLIFILALLILGCQQQPKTQTQTIIKQTKASSAQQAKVARAFEEAKNLQEKHSKWFNRNEKLPLTIIATAYINPEVTQTKEYRIYNKFLKQIQKDSTILDKLSDSKLSSKYSSIKFVNYNTNLHAKEKFNAAYTNQHSDKEKLTDILRPDLEIASQELLIRLNLEELKKGNLTIEGYKTVKQKDKLRNSSYYTLRKTNYKKLNDKEKKQAIINSILATLQLSIPEYVSIDRKEFIKDGEVLRFITPQKDGSYTGEVWKYQIEDRAAKVEQEIEQLNENSTTFGKTLKVLKGHTQSVSAVAISPNGKYALSGSWDETLGYWNLKTGKTIRILRGHTNLVTSVAISSNGKYALSGNIDKILRYWNLKTGKTIKVLKGHTEKIYSVTISPDGKYALSGGGKNKGKDFALRYWNLKTGKIIKVLKGHTEKIYSVTISPDGKYALSGGGKNEGKDFVLRYWNLKTGKILKVLEGHKDIVTSVAISPDGKYALSGSWDKTLRYWNLETGKIIKVLNGHTDKVSSVAINPDGNYAISGSTDKKLRYWNLQTGKTIKVLEGHKDGVNSVAISPNGQYALSGAGKYDGKDYDLRYWNLFLTNKEKKKEDKLLEQIQYIKDSKSYISRETTQRLMTLKFSKKDLNTLSKTKYIKTIKDIASSLNYEYDNPILTLIFPNIYNSYTNTNLEFIDKTILMKKKEKYSLDELYFSTNFSLKDAGYVKIKEIKSINIELKKPKILEGHNEGITSVAISQDGKYALSGSNDKTIRYWNLETGKTIKVLEGHINWVKSVSISQDGKYALSGAKGKILRYWSLKTGKTLQILKGDSAGTSSVVISPDGKYTLSGDFALRYWNLKTGEILKVLKGHTEIINSVAISQDGKYALSGGGSFRQGKDFALRYWNLKTGKILKVLKGHTDSVKSVAVSKDGNYALSGSWNGTIRYWNLKTGKTIKVLRGHTKSVWSVAIGPDGQYALSGSGDKTLRYWNLKTGKTIKILRGHKRGVWSVAISQDGKYALSGSIDKTLRYWSLNLVNMNADY